MKTVSLSLAKELKENGYPQESYFTWVKDYSRGGYQIVSEDFEDGGFLLSGDNNFTAPTADEILDRLPQYILKPNNCNYYIKIIKTPYFDYEISYTAPSGEILGEDPGDGRNTNPNKNIDKDLANSAARCWLYLKKENLL